MDRRRFAQSIASGLIGGGLLSGGNIEESRRNHAPGENHQGTPSPSDVSVSEEMCFSTIAALKEASVPETGTLAYAFGYHEVGDGGGGLFRWDGSVDSAENDGGLRVASRKSEIGVWQRVITDGMHPVTLWGARGDGKTDDRPAVQRALDAHSTLYFPSGTYLIDGSEGQNRGSFGGVFPTSNQVLVFGRGAKLKVMEDDGYYSGINLTAVDDVSLINPHVQGDRQLRGEENCQNRQKCEFGHCINIQGGVSNVYIEDPVCHDGWGDGLYVKVPNTRLNLTVVGGHFYNNRRNGISVVAARGATFQGTRLTGNGGTSPHKGIDVEPNGPDYPVQDIQFIGCTARSHNNAGFSVAFGLAGSLNEEASVHFEGCTSENDGRGFLHEAAQGIPGIVTMSDCVVRCPQRNGLMVENWDTSLVVNDLTVFHPNRSQQSDPRRGAALRIEVNSDDTITGNVVVSDFTCIGDGKGSAIDVRRMGGRSGDILENISIEGESRGLKDYSNLSDINRGTASVSFSNWKREQTVTTTTDEDGDVRVQHGLSTPPNVVHATLKTGGSGLLHVVFRGLATETEEDDTLVFRVFNNQGSPVSRANVTVSWRARFRPY